MPSNRAATSSNSHATGLSSANPAATTPKTLRILHFNDVYEIFPRNVEPVGGAARFVHAVQGLTTPDTLVLFSGDAFNPSLLSALTCGEHMVGVLNAAGVHAACVGNHDFDFGVEQLRALASCCSFPWLLSNVLAADGSGAPPAGLARSCLLRTASGTTVGVLGLVEEDWLATVPCLAGGLESGLQFLDPGATATELAGELRAQGADLVVALTHQRAARDAALAAGAPELQLVLGGHDHHWAAVGVPPHGTLVVKSGTDFRELSVLDLSLGSNMAMTSRDGVGDELHDDDRHPPVAGSFERPRSNAAVSKASSTPSSCVPPRPCVDVTRVVVDSNTPEHAATAALVASYALLLGDQLDLPLGWTHTALDARSGCMRRDETALGNLLADAMRAGLKCDAAVLNSGTVRSDRVHPAGQLTLRDVASMLPFTDELVAVDVSGKELEAVLETGVSAWPAQEGRFLQVSGLAFRFDPDASPGRRLVPGSVLVGGLPLDPDRRYSLAGKQYICSGRDGFEVLRGATPLPRPAADWPSLASLMRHLFGRVEALNEGLIAPVAGDADSSTGSPGSAIDSPLVPNPGVSGSTGEAMTLPAQALLQPFEQGLLELIVYDNVTGKYGVAPRVEGRICRTCGPPADHAS